MPIWFRVFLLGFILIFWLIVESVYIPFIYSNEYFLIVSLMYFILALALSFGVILRTNSDNTLFRNTQKETLKQKIVICLSAYLLGPFLFGFSFSRLAPLVGDIFSSNAQVCEYQYLKSEAYAKTFRQLRKVYIAQRNSVSKASFILNNNTFNSLSLHEGQNIILKGRVSVLGFVIDKIEVNGVNK